MMRFLCVYFTKSKDLEINKYCKKVIVIEALKGSDAKDMLIGIYNAKRIKRIRCMNCAHPKPYLYDEDLHKLEIRNNFNLKEYKNNVNRRTIHITY